jgi:hypothetical protein
MQKSVHREHVKAKVISNTGALQCGLLLHRALSPLSFPCPIPFTLLRSTLQPILSFCENLMETLGPHFSYTMNE